MMHDAAIKLYQNPTSCNMKGRHISYGHDCPTSNACKNITDQAGCFLIPYVCVRERKSTIDMEKGTSSARLIQIERYIHPFYPIGGKTGTSAIRAATRQS